MGYNTTLSGELRLPDLMTAAQLRRLVFLLRHATSDAMDQTEFLDLHDLAEPGQCSDAPAPLRLYDLELNETMTAIVPRSCGKVYGLVDQVRYVIEDLRKLDPYFALTGEIYAMGEDFNDRWFLRLDDGGMPYKVETDVVPRGTVKCPQCGHDFQHSETEA